MIAFATTPAAAAELPRMSTQLSSLVGDFRH